MELNKIQSLWDWGQASAAMNANFEKIKLELMKLRFASILTFCKGYFSTESRFLSKCPTGKDGQYAFVGSPWPGTVYEWVDAKWVNTGITPQLGEGLFVEFLKRHIDSDTIYWEETNRVIKAKGGGSAPGTYTITATLNTADIGKCTVTATGAVSVTESDDKAVYTIVGNVGSNVMVKIVPKTGYAVMRLNVDKVSQGSTSEYTFHNLSFDHSMYVWIQTEVFANPTDWLERSDLPGVYYSKMQDAFNAVKASYPGKLTRDVTISCIKNATYKRTSGTWVGELSRWNKSGLYTLTIDGAGLMSLNCASLGGLRFDRVDNIVVRNTGFSNFVNNIEAYSPDELSALNFIGDVESYSRNFYVENCTIDGKQAATEFSMGQYGIVSKYAENLYVVKNRMTNINCIPLKLVDTRVVSLVRNYVKADHSSNIIGHPALCTLTNSRAIIAEDNEFTGNTGEYLFFLTNVERIIFRRNNIHDVGGEGLKITSKNPVRELTLDNNLFVNVVSQPAYSWLFNYVILECSVNTVNVLNNTAYINGQSWQQWFVRATSGVIDTINFYNNIISDATSSSIPMRCVQLYDVNHIHSGNNLYQLKQKNGKPENIFYANGIVGSNNLESMQSQGYEVDSNLVAVTDKILDIQHGGSTYRPAGGLEYYSDMNHFPIADIEYKSRASSGNTRGCYNLAGIAIDESQAGTRYTGEDMSESGSFDSSSLYTTLAGSLLLVMHGTPNRQRFVRMKLTGAQHSSLILGRYGCVEMLPVLDEHGEYVEDESYTVNIE